MPLQSKRKTDDTFHIAVAILRISRVSSSIPSERNENIKVTAINCFTLVDFSRAPAEHKEERIKRPMNAFMVFSHQARKMIAKENPNLKNSDLSKYLGATWK